MLNAIHILFLAASNVTTVIINFTSHLTLLTYAEVSDNVYQIHMFSYILLASKFHNVWPNSEHICLVFFRTEPKSVK